MDEGYTVIPVVQARGVSDLVSLVRRFDTQPPGSHVVLLLLRRVLPATDFGFRLPSLLAAEAGLLLLYGGLSRIWGSAAALLAVALAQFSPFLGFYAMEARNYALWFLCVAASLFIVVRWHGETGEGRERGAWGWSVAWGVVNGIGLWIHLFHLFFIAGQLAAVAAALAAERRSGRNVARRLQTAVLAQAVAALLFAPWIAVLIEGWASGRAGVGWTRPFSWISLPYYPFALQFDASFGPSLRDLHTRAPGCIISEHGVSLALAGAGLIILAAAYLLLLRDARRDPARRWELVPFLLVPAVSLLGPLAYAAGGGFPMHPRHLMFLWPLLPAALALAFLRHRRLRPALAALFVLQAVAFGNLLWNDVYAKDDERGAVRFAEARSGPRACVFGDVAPVYTSRARGFVKAFVDFRSGPLFDGGTTDVWWIDNRGWEDPEGRFRRNLERALVPTGLVEDGEPARFRGLVLHHWRVP